MGSTPLYLAVAFTPPEICVLTCDLILQAVINKPGSRAPSLGILNERQWHVVWATLAKFIQLWGQLRIRPWINAGLLLLIRIPGARGNANGGLGPPYGNCWVESLIFWKCLLAELPVSFTCLVIKMQLGKVLRNNCHFHFVPVM